MSLLGNVRLLLGHPTVLDLVIAAEKVYFYRI